MNMFDQLIDSEARGANTKPRSRYFICSSLVMGVLFLVGVVASIYAADYALGAESLELRSLVMPLEMEAEAPPIEQPKRTVSSAPKSNVATRSANIARTDEPIAPNTISTTKNTSLSRPNGNFVIGKIDSDGPSAASIERSGPSGPGGGSDSGFGDEPAKIVEKDRDIAPPVKKVEQPKRIITQSLGVINGRATNLPKPIYPQTAIAVHAQGAVSVQVTIDETGKVVSARAADGHPLLRDAAVKAAWQARFSPTLLSNVPVKVTGVIVYNFTH